MMSTVVGLPFEVEGRVRTEHDVRDGPGGRAAVFEHVEQGEVAVRVEEWGRDGEEVVLESVEEGLETKEVRMAMALIPARWRLPLVFLPRWPIL